MLWQGTNADWCSVIILGRMLLIRFAKTFAIILDKTLHNAMGQRSFTLSACSFLEMNTTFVSFKPSGNIISFSQCVSSEKFQHPKCSKNAEKKAELLSGCICLIASVNSSKVKSSNIIIEFFHEFSSRTILCSSSTYLQIEY